MNLALTTRVDHGSVPKAAERHVTAKMATLGWPVRVRWNPTLPREPDQASDPKKERGEPRPNQDEPSRLGWKQQDDTLRGARSLKQPRGEPRPNQDDGRPD